VLGISKGNTFSLWAVEPSYSNAAGTINFGGGSPAGYTGSAGTVLTITWRSKGAGPARVTFSNGSVLAADGRGTNVVQSLNGGTYTIAAADVQPEPETIEYIAPANTPGTPNISSETHQADGWSQATEAKLSWSIPGDVTAVRTLLDTNSGTIPTKVYEPPINSITLSELDEGVQYFHLQFRNTEGWGRVAHYRLAVDTEAPTEFSITRSDAYDVSSPTQELRFSSSDATSPVTRYRIQHNGGEPYEFVDETGSSTLTLTELEPGQQSFVIEAFDAAGNSRVATISFTIEAFAAPVWTEYPAEVGASVVPVFFGSTRPGATVYATIAPVGRGDQGDVPLEYVLGAEEDGSFRIVPDGRLSEGVYELSAYAIDSHGSQSATSETVRFLVAQPGYIAFGQWAVSIMSVLVPLVALTLLLVLLLLYGRARIRRIRRVVVAETGEALTVLERQFTTLRETVTAESQTLRGSRKTKKLTKAEQQLVDDTLAHIDAAEQTIRKEISEVDDIVS
tara:strand:+ start:2262 stop:3782 length:1521 start_codon:yes stop_codon:yes gene_type:complete